MSAGKRSEPLAGVLGDVLGGRSGAVEEGEGVTVATSPPCRRSRPGQLVDLVLVVAQHMVFSFTASSQSRSGPAARGFGELGVRALEVLDGVVEAGLLLF